tara:strand:- start:7342 stop:7614 length:273 start_codon:yes stop_codon:yes gene_type:complete
MQILIDEILWENFFVVKRRGDGQQSSHVPGQQGNGYEGLTDLAMQLGNQVYVQSDEICLPKPVGKEDIVTYGHEDGLFRVWSPQTEGRYR